jgi:TPR repeat protein
MDKALRQELLAKTKQALDADDWSAVERLWQPWVQQGDPEAQYQLAYHCLWCRPCAQNDDATIARMNELLQAAAAKDHPDAIWFTAENPTHSAETDLEFERLILRAGQLGSANAQRRLGVMYATGDWSGPKDLAEAVRWYRLSAEQGHAESQYDLGFMLLLGEGGPKNTEEGLMWLERAAEQGEDSAFRLLVDCYEEGHCDVPVNAAKAELWRGRLEEYERLNPCRRYSVEGAVGESSLEYLFEIEGVKGVGGLVSEDNQFSVSYDPALLTPAQLDEKIRAAGIPALPID